MSTLERLYSYAKAAGAGALENFTTEALAGAIRDDPAPMLRLLRDAELLPPSDTMDLDLDTQVVLPGTGVLDLVLVAVGDGHRHELWLEIKVNAGESGTQLDAYRRHLERIPAALRPTLITLGPHAVRDDPTIPFLTWHRLRRMIGPTDTHGWRDFATYLAEVRMSDDFDQPVAAREAAALDDFRYLHGKVARIISDTAQAAAVQWPLLGWPTNEPTLRKKLFDRFASHQQLVVGVQRAKSCWLVLGTEPSAGEAQLMISVETWPSAADIQREILGRAEAAALSADWHRSLGAWGGLKRAERLVVLGDHDSAVAWLMERIGELSAAGVLGIVVGNESPNT